MLNKLHYTLKNKMVKIIPFKAIRPTRDKASLVASRSYLTYSDETIKEKLDHNPYTFLHIINPNYNNPNKETGKAKFKLVKRRFDEFIKQEILKKDDSEHFYIYQNRNQINTFTGIIGAASIEDYLSNNIKKHEQTIKKREEIFCNYLETTGFNADPVLLTHEPNENIKKILEKFTKSRSEYEFTTTNKSTHKLWLVSNKLDIKNIKNVFKDIKYIYIADGHHRCASSALLFKNNKSLLNSYFMSYLIDENQLRILNFNRLVKHLNGLSPEELLIEIKKKYTIIQKNKITYAPNIQNEISMYLNKKWYSLTANKQKYASISRSLDPSILSENILNPLLNIIDERTNKDIKSLNGTIPLTTIKKLVDCGEYAVAFILKSIPISLIKQVADNNETMPPKSTYVEPKLRSGLTIYPII